MANARINILLSVRDDGTKAIKAVSNEMGDFGKKGQSIVRKLVTSWQFLGTLLAGGIAVGFFQATKEALSYAAALSIVSEKIGFTTDELQEMRFAGEQVSVNQQTLDMGLQRFSRRIAEVAAGTGELKGIIDEYGIAVRDSNGDTRANIDILGDLADAIQGAGSEQEQLRIAFKAFDSEGAALVNILKNGSEGLDQMRNRAQALGIVIDENMVRKAEEAQARLDELSATISGQFRRALVELSPEIESFAKDLTDFITEDGPLILDFFRDLVGLIKDVVDGFRTSKTEALKLEIVADAESMGLLDNRKMLGFWTLNTDALLRDIKKTAPELFAKHGIDPNTFLPIGGGDGVLPSPTRVKTQQDAGGGDLKALKKQQEFLDATSKAQWEFVAKQAAAGLAEENNNQEHLDNISKARWEFIAKQAAAGLAEEESNQQLLDNMAQARFEFLARIATMEREAQEASLSNWDNWREGVIDTWDEAFAEGQTLAGQFFDDFGQQVAAALVDGDSFGKGMEGVFKSLSKVIISELAKTTAAFIAESIAKMIQSEAETIVVVSGNVAQGVSEAGAQGSSGGPWGAAAMMAATLAVFVAAMAAARGAFGGGAAGGLGFVPANQTFLLHRGERVLSPRQNVDFTEFMKQTNKGGGGGPSHITVVVPIDGEVVARKTVEVWRDGRGNAGRLSPVLQAGG